MDNYVLQFGSHKKAKTTVYILWQAINYTSQFKLVHMVS